MAQFVFALLLELCHRVGMHSEAVRAGEWSRSPDWCFWKSPLMELAGRTMGIVGFGRIGRTTARIADAMGMTVIANDAVESAAPDYPGFRWVGIEELLREGDVVSLHAPLFPETSHMINQRSLDWMKPGAFLINTSRGPLVVDEDLADALHAGKLAGAAMDVLSQEPPRPDNPLLSARNCIVTPHIAWATIEARTRLMEIAVGNISGFLGGNPRNVIK